jgi:NitT/TauT family transport system substrate-binding protein
MSRYLAAAFCGLLVALLGQQWALAAPEIRIGVLAFGTVNWELAALEQEGPGRERPFAIAATKLASAEAAKIALQGGSVDVIVADWIWVARQREQGLDFVFAPYSTSHGALMVAAGSPIHSIADLKGRKLGVAGGGIDKNWLLLQALAQRKYRFDLQHSAEISFGAPPLLNEQLSQGRLDALLNYWHYAARLEARGFKKILDGSTLLRELGIDAELANLGYVFRESWVNRQAAAWQAFLDASTKARTRLCENDPSWQRIVPLTGESDARTLALLRRGYCEGTVKRWGAAEVKAAAQVFEILRETGGGLVSSRTAQLPPGVFWSQSSP